MQSIPRYVSCSLEVSKLFITNFFILLNTRLGNPGLATTLPKIFSWKVKRNFKANGILFKQNRQKWGAHEVTLSSPPKYGHLMTAAYANQITSV